MKRFLVALILGVVFLFSGCATTRGPVIANVNKMAEKIYHIKGCPNFSRIIVKPEEGDQVFAEAREAEACGFVLAGNCYR